MSGDAASWREKVGKVDYIPPENCWDWDVVPIVLEGMRSEPADALLREFLDRESSDPRRLGFLTGLLERKDAPPATPKAIVERFLDRTEDPTLRMGIVTAMASAPRGQDRDDTTYCEGSQHVNQFGWPIEDPEPIFSYLPREPFLKMLDRVTADRRERPVMRVFSLKLRARLRDLSNTEVTEGLLGILGSSLGDGGVLDLPEGGEAEEVFFVVRDLRDYPCAASRRAAELLERGDPWIQELGEETVWIGEIAKVLAFEKTNGGWKPSGRESDEEVAFLLSVLDPDRHPMEAEQVELLRARHSGS